MFFAGHAIELALPSIDPAVNLALCALRDDQRPQPLTA